MTEFVIRLADERGRVQEQTHCGGDGGRVAGAVHAGRVLRLLGEGARAAGRAGKNKKVKLETFLVFNQQFLTLIRAGLPILGSIELLARRQKLPHFRAQLEDVATRVKNGESISEAFEAQGGFPVVYTTTLLAGERSGNLEEVLQRYLDFQRVRLTFRKKLTASLIYPAVLVVMVIGLFIFLITFVVPRFAELYDQLGTKLPAMTTFLLALGKNAQSYGIYVGGSAGAGHFPAVPVDEDGFGRDPGGQGADQSAADRLGVAEVPGGAVLADAVDAAEGRVAAGAEPGDGGAGDR